MVRIADPASTLVPRLRGLHLFHFDGAPCAQRVRFALAEKGFRRGAEVRWDDDSPGTLVAEPGTWTSRVVSLVRKDHLTPGYAAINPHLVIPALVQDGVLHLESMDIVAHADSLSPVGTLLPRDATAAADAAALVELGKQLHRSIRYVSFRWNLGGLARLDAKEEAFVASREPGDSPEQLAAFYAAFDRDGIDEATYAQHARMLDEALAALDARLASDGRAFLVGAALSHADIIWSIKVLKLVECGYPLAARHPHLARWYARVSSRPAFRGGVMGRHRFMSGAFRLRATIDRWLGRGLSHALAAR